MNQQPIVWFAIHISLMRARSLARVLVRFTPTARAAVVFGSVPPCCVVNELADGRTDSGLPCARQPAARTDHDRGRWFGEPEQHVVQRNFGVASGGRPRSVDARGSRRGAGNANGQAECAWSGWLAGWLFFLRLRRSHGRAALPFLCGGLRAACEFALPASLTHALTHSLTHSPNVLTLYGRGHAASR